MITKKNAINIFVIITICIIIFRNKNINSGTFLGIFIGLLISIYFLFIVKKKEVEEENLEQEMLKEIRKPIDEISDYPEFIYFLYWIQDFYNYNPQVYEELISTINNFIMCYEEGLLKESGKRYNLMNSKKNQAINTLYSFIYTIPLNKTYKKKLKYAMKRLDGILQYYLDIIEKKYNEDLKKGYNSETQILQKGVKPENFYLEKEFCVF